MKGLLRFALAWLLAALLTPYAERLIGRFLSVAPEGSFLEDVLQEIDKQYATSLVHTVSETIGSLVLGD